MPRRSRADRRGTILLGTGMTLSNETMPECSPRRREPFSDIGGVSVVPKTALVESKPIQQGDSLDAVYAAMTEAEFQNHVESGLRQRGFLVFHVRDARLMAAGLPDIVAVRDGQLVAFELKRERGGKISTAQRDAIAVFGTVPGVYARFVRPSEWNAILADLDR